MKGEAKSGSALRVLGRYFSLAECHSLSKNISISLLIKRVKA